MVGKVLRLVFRSRCHTCQARADTDTRHEKAHRNTSDRLKSSFGLWVCHLRVFSRTKWYTCCLLPRLTQGFVLMAIAPEPGFRCPRHFRPEAFHFRMVLRTASTFPFILFVFVTRFTFSERRNPALKKCKIPPQEISSNWPPAIFIQIEESSNAARHLEPHCPQHVHAALRLLNHPVGKKVLAWETYPSHSLRKQC